MLLLSTVDVKGNLCLNMTGCRLDSHVARRRNMLGFFFEAASSIHFLVTLCTTKPSVSEKTDSSPTGMTLVRDLFFWKRHFDRHSITSASVTIRPSFKISSARSSACFRRLFTAAIATIARLGPRRLSRTQERNMRVTGQTRWVVEDNRRRQWTYVFCFRCGTRVCRRVRGHSHELISLTMRSENCLGHLA